MLIDRILPSSGDAIWVSAGDALPDNSLSKHAKAAFSDGNVNRSIINRCLS
ncbi:hypothetical protein I6F26_26115 [Ensifer sp. IC3342]|nr:hypothetical protein [Ensifer sp. BRP08]MCA1450035.1 hypothetical protein [Ensifer sp. IC3342]